jgi:hypothetical protein
VFARYSRAWVGQMRMEFDRLEGLCDSRHTQALRWLNWLTFKVGQPEPVADGALFHRFWMTC